MLGLYSTQFRSGYAAAKHAAQGWIDSVRIECVNDGIHFLTVSPGFVNTDVSRNALTAEGSLHGQKDAKVASGLAPETVARDILRAIQKRQRDIFPAGFQEKLALVLSKFAPGLLDKILAKSEVK